jgi:hypothetical protein
MLCGKQALCPAYPKKGRRCAHTVGIYDGKKPRGPLLLQKNALSARFLRASIMKDSKKNHFMVLITVAGKFITIYELFI